MKTALDLPDDLAREIKMHAVQQGRKLKDVIAELLRRGLDVSNEPAPALAAPFETDSRTGLPVIRCRQTARVTPNRVSEILLAQEAEWHREAGR